MLDLNTGEPTRPRTSGIGCFGAEDGSVLSALVNLQGPVVPLLLYPKSSSVQVIAVGV